VRVTCVVVLKCVIMYCTVDKSHSSGASATQPRTMKDGKPPCKLFAAVFARCGSLSPPPHKKNTTRGGPHRGPGSNTQSERGCLGAPGGPTAAFCNKYGARSLAPVNRYHRCFFGTEGKNPACPVANHRAMLELH
jgi:hypothetical protein